MFNRLGILKTVLWLIVGAWATVTVVRFVNGLGATTALNDATPWGMWIAFDVMAGVALAAGGFVIAATVYIFGLEKYRPFARPAILTAFLGYAAVAIGLLYDLGLPWNIWHPMLHWQHHSVLFEVAMCVMLYLSVLAMEFAPVALEHSLFSHPLFRLIHNILKKVTILLVIAGIVLSTLHQSSLGSLFLITPARLHPLWYSPHIYLFFFISAIGLGLMTIALESILSGWFLRHKVRTDLLSGLGAAAACVLGFYAIARLVELAVYGKFGLLFSSGWYSALFFFELVVSAILPALLLAIPSVRRSAAGVTTCACMTVFGMVLYRFDVCLIAFTRPGELAYFPSWTEIAVSAGIVSGAALVFIFFVENLKVYIEDEPSHAAPKRSMEKPSFDPATIHALLPYRFLGPRRYSLMFVAGAALAVVLLPGDALFGPQTLRTPVSAPRTVNGYLVPQASGFGNDMVIADHMAEPPMNGRPTKFMVLDGNRNGRSVLFSHDHHVEELGDGKFTCVKCHHMNMPHDQDTSCYECHRDMYETTDIFDHDAHIHHLRGNEGCVKCHTDPTAVKNRDTATPCKDCHMKMIAGGFPNTSASGVEMKGFAAGYKHIMHDEFARKGLCIGCHEEWADKMGRRPGGEDSGLTRCDACHSEIQMQQSVNQAENENPY